MCLPHLPLTHTPSCSTFLLRIEGRWIQPMIQIAHLQHRAANPSQTRRQTLTLLAPPCIPCASPASCPASGTHNPVASHKTREWRTGFSFCGTPPSEGTSRDLGLPFSRRRCNSIKVDGRPGLEDVIGRYWVILSQWLLEDPSLVSSLHVSHPSPP